MAERTVDRTRFPALADYLAHLPAGLASYPQATSRGIILRSAVSPHYFHPSWKELPTDVIAAVKAPPLPTSWISTAVTDAIFCLIADTFYPSDQAVRDWSYDRTIRLASLPMYATLTQLAGLDRFLEGVAKIHGRFQRGTDLEVKVTGTEAEVVLKHPPHLHGPLNHLSNEGVFRAALEATRASDVRVSMIESTPTFARYTASWRI
jgi:hypothetical protein